MLAGRSDLALSFGMFFAEQEFEARRRSA